MQLQLANILVFVGLGVVFLGAILLIGSLVRPQVAQPEKAAIYECGETPIAQAWFNFNPRFYIVALVFLIFDVEVAFTYPVATAFRRWVDGGVGLFAFFEIFLFVAILAVGLAYVWVKGDLEWIRRSKDDAEWRQMPTQMPATMPKTVSRGLADEGDSAARGK